jgi:hypothetical protein
MNEYNLQGVSVSVSRAMVMQQEAVGVIKDPAVTEFDEPTFAKLAGVRFTDGTIAVKVLSRLLADAPDFARGFIGVAFRIREDNAAFECIYLRPTNGRAAQQLRRNRAIQYFSYPDHKFERLRREAPGEYETYADMGLNEWIDMRIEVRGAQALLFLNDHPQPALIVNDLKHGSNAAGAVGLWVDIGTEGYFANMRIQHIEGAALEA